MWMQEIYSVEDHNIAKIVLPPSLSKLVYKVILN
jgi:hypothetical protein